MFKDRMPSIGDELKHLEGENPWATLSSLKEQKRSLEDRIGPDNWSPDDRVLLIQLTEKIERLENDLRYKKAA